MANANDLIGSDTARMLIVGRPGLSSATHDTLSLESEGGD